MKRQIHCIRIEVFFLFFFFFYQSLALNFLFTEVCLLLFIFSDSYCSSYFCHHSFCLSTVSTARLIISPFRFSTSHTVLPTTSLSPLTVHPLTVHTYINACTHTLSVTLEAKWTALIVCLFHSDTLIYRLTYSLKTDVHTRTRAHTLPFTLTHTCRCQRGPAG